MCSKIDIEKTISTLSAKLKETYHVKNLSLFGSYARGEQREDSDIDILVDFDVTPDLLTFIELEEFLSQKLNQEVDLVPVRKLKSSLREQILSEAVTL